MAEPNGVTPTERIHHIDGRTLEGGGQLVRNALTLSSLTRKPITITHIRGKREGGKKGLKGSHVAAVRFLADVCHAQVKGAGVGSETLEFIPERGSGTTEDDGDNERRSLSTTVKPEYVIELPTAGSVFLVFQALYPYLLRAGAGAGLGTADGKVRLRITGGTNVPKAPSFDYVAQVFVPTLRRLGFPALDVRLRKRGWSTGSSAANLGTVEIDITPLEGESPETARFPVLDLDRWTRGAVVGVDVTVLAPDDPLDINGREEGSATTVREHLERRTLKAIRRALKFLSRREKNCVDLDEQDSLEAASEGDTKAIPVTIHVSEKTYHQSHIYMLLVAHTANGFRLGVDALFGGFGDGGKAKGKGKGKDKNKSKYKNKQKESKTGTCQAAAEKNRISDMQSSLDAFADGCVDDLLEELLPEDPSESADPTSRRHRPCVDVHMRDQLVIFDALARIDHGVPAKAADDECLAEDDKYWSLHTRTARWVCEEILGPGLWPT